MAYQICILKNSPCCVVPWSVGCTITTSPAAGVRVIDVYGCTPDLTAGINTAECSVGVVTPVGCCCTWTVPIGQTSIVVELWGGGGGGGAGASASCCGAMPGAGAGSYMKKTLTVSAGQVITICAGAGGCGGVGTCLTDSYCCCGNRGSCSFVLINGTFCIDAQGGASGQSQCYWFCGCNYLPLGNIFNVSGCGPCGANGSWGGCTGYTADIYGSPTSTFIAGCSGVGYGNAPSSGGGTTFGGDNSFSGGNFSANNYTRWGAGSCTNTAGITGPGGDPVNPSVSTSAYNTPGTANYTCSNVFCGQDTINAPPPGNFPGGGGAGGSNPCCCFWHSPGGHGAPGYVRIWY